MKFTIKSLALSGVALGMLTAVANAADPVVSTSDWTGFSIGIGGGGSFSFAETNAAGGGVFDVSGDSGWMDRGYFEGNYVTSGGLNSAYTNHDEDSGGDAYLAAGASMGNAGSLIADFLAEEFESDNKDPNDTGHAGFLGTGTIGADYQLDRFVVGLDASFSFGRTEINNQAEGYGEGEIDVYDSGDYSEGEGDGDARLDTSLELGNSWSVGARAGFLATDSTLIFGSAGYTSTNAKLKAHFNGDADAETSGGSSGGGDVSGDASASWDVEAETDDWMSGYYVGGGVEQLLTSNLSLKLEYRYADLGTIETSESLSDSGGVPGDGYEWDAQVAAEADVTTHSVVATVNFRF
jgi:outer membrane immunogenic protein